jgi:hypothetical protein
MPHWGQRALQRSVIWITTCPGMRLFKMDLSNWLKTVAFYSNWRDFIHYRHIARWRSIPRPLLLDG